MKIRTFLMLVLLLSLGACQQKESQTNGKPLIVATTGMLGDLASRLCGGFADVQVLMGPGVDPHLYKASQGDMQLISSASVILYNGLHLEGKMVEVLEKSSRSKPVLAAGTFVDTDAILNSENSGAASDPHIWMDVNIWLQAVSGIADSLQGLFPAAAGEIAKSKTNYVNELKVLDLEVDSLIQLIPVESRVLITSHDAFRYFGSAYGMEVKGLQGISTVSEYGLRDVSNLSDLIISRKIKSVFVETSVSSKSLESVVSSCKKQGWDVSIGGTLYSDSMGESGTPEGTYVGMIRHNAQTISNSLK
jgi:manganese/zinc/iron transport system substrate-binding protein